MLTYLTVLLIAGVINLLAEDTMAVSDLLMVPFGVALVGGGMLFLFENTLAFLIFICLIPVAVVAFLRLRKKQREYVPTHKDVSCFEEMFHIIEDRATDREVYGEKKPYDIYRDLMYVVEKSKSPTLMNIAENSEPPARWIPVFPDMPSEQYVMACEAVARRMIGFNPKESDSDADTKQRNWECWDS